MMNKNNLDLIEKKIQVCNECNDLLKLNCNTISLGKNTDILFIGESPAKNGWIATGRAFYDSKDRILPTGRILNKLLEIIDLTIDDITFTEACKCHIPDRKLLKNASSNCLKYLKEQIKELDSKIVITLGEHPTRILIDEQFKKLGDVAGKTFIKQINDYEVIIIPIYHPSPINPNGYKLNVPIFEKIKKLREIILFNELYDETNIKVSKRDIKK